MNRGLRNLGPKGCDPDTLTVTTRGERRGFNGD